MTLFLFLYAVASFVGTFLALVAFSLCKGSGPFEGNDHDHG